MKEFTINADFVRVLEGSLKDAEVGRLFVAMCNYALTGAEAELRGNERMLWAGAKLMIDGRLVVTDPTVKINGQTVKNHTYIRERDNKDSSCIDSTNKTTKKRTSTDYSVEFEHFWMEYPKDRRVDKQIAYQAWQKIDPDEELVAKIVESVKAWKQCEQWSDPQFIPHPSKFLNCRRWESNPPERRPKNPALQYKQSPINTDDFDAMLVNLDEMRLE